MQRTLGQREKSLKPFIKYRWLYTFAYLYVIAAMVDGIFDKRSQWPFILRLSLPLSVPIWHSIWGNIFTAALFSFFLISGWVRIHNYRRDLLFAEQLTLQKAAKPPEGSWPPPPQQEPGV